jgi:hypothetical protein
VVAGALLASASLLDRPGHQRLGPQTSKQPFDQASRLDPEKLGDLLLELRLAQLSLFHLVVQLVASDQLSRGHGSCRGEAQAFTVGTQGGEEVRGDHAAEVEQQAFMVGHGSMQPLTGRLVRTGQDQEDDTARAGHSFDAGAACVEATHKRAQLP